MQEHGCYSDYSHRHAKHLARTALERLFVNLPENINPQCRREHEEYDRNGTTPLPDIEFMRQAILNAAREGRITLSKTKERIVA